MVSAETTTAKSAERPPNAVVVRVADPYGGDVVGCVANKPCVGVVLGRAGLAGRRVPDVCPHTGTSLDVRAKDPGDLVGLAVAQDLLTLTNERVLLDALPFDVADRRRNDPVAAVCQRGVPDGHVQWRDFL